MECSVSFGRVPLDRLRDLSQAAEELGYAAIYFPDHLVSEGPERQSAGVPSHDPMVQAAISASATARVRIGHLVLCNLFRHPALTARSLATLDELSNGRVVVGLGSGWTETEFRMTGIDFPEIAPRLRMLDEALACIRGLWRPEPFSFEGEFYRFRDASLLPRPVQERPPVLLGGGGRGLLRIAARHADVVNIVSDTGRAGYIAVAKAIELNDAAFRNKVGFVRAEAERAGRDPRAIRFGGLLYNIHLTPTRAAAESAVESLAKAFGVSTASILASPLFLIGTPDDCIAELRRRAREWELSEVVLSGAASLEILERFGREILPHV
ncbi:MAG TPA: LLM class flavin-dependent oxidoreductase [Candidatus Binatia bacterium]|nr:LLM class flavin-dependent oxidoreductase [Candidatus Binatia bacterium]